MYEGTDDAFAREGLERKFRTAIASWYSAVDGQIPLRSALNEICEAFGADAACVSRYADRADIPPRLIVFDRRPPGAFIPRLTRAYTHCVLGEFARRARPGTIWPSSSVSDLDPALTTFQSRRALKDLLVCPLGAGEDGFDYLEIHFETEPDGDRLSRIETAALSLSQSWRNRKAGGFFERIVAAARPAGPAEQVDLLAFGNPAGLSRAEYRVCLLLGRGLSNEAVKGELSITNATLRTHLRNIYGKTGVENKAELVYRLLAAPKSETRRSRGIA